MNIDIGDVREMLECGTATNMELTEAVEFLLRERRALGREIVRLKIAHLRRMADSASIDAAWSRFCDGRRRSRDSMQRAWDRLDRFRSACLAKITELKESQCSTKP